MKKKDKKILMEFLSYPLGSTDMIFERFSVLSGAICRGEGLKRFVYIRGKRKNKVLLVAHADTFWDKEYRKKTVMRHKIIERNGVLRSGTKKFGIGADDRAGCAILWLLKGMGHSILLTNGEERKMKGSTWLMKKNPDIADEINNEHQFVIQLDRRNRHEFKCYCVGTKKFRRYIKKNTGFQEPDKKLYTDIVALCRDIAGANLSVGYRKEHTPDEELNLVEWQHTLNVCRKWLGNPKLPKFRRKI